MVKTLPEAKLLTKPRSRNENIVLKISNFINSNSYLIEYNA